MVISNDTLGDLRAWPARDVDDVDDIQRRLRELVRSPRLTEDERRTLLVAAQAAENLRIALIGVVNRLTAGRIEELERSRGRDAPAEVAIDGGGVLHRRDRGAPR